MSAPVRLTGDISTGRLVGWKKGSVSLVIPDGGECVGDRRTSEEKVGWKDLASKRASSLLKRSDHFSSN